MEPGRAVSHGGALAFCPELNLCRSASLLRREQMLSLTKTKKEIEYELPPIDRAMRLAGFAFAQAASSLAEGTAPLVPLGYVERKAGLRSAERVMVRFTYPSAESVDLALSTREGRSALMAKLPEYDSSVLVFGGYLRRSLAPSKSDVLIVEINDVAFEPRFKVIQYYQPHAAGGFRLLGSPIFLQDDDPLDPVREAELAARFLDGTKCNSLVEKAWVDWRG
jgi:hypothetical protein